MARTATSLEVLRTEPLGPHMIRVVLGGDELARFPDTGYTDRYVKLLFTPPGVEYPEPFDVEAIRRELPREQWPRIRTYTVRRLDHDAGELTIDFVHHGDSGVAGPWAAAARPGDLLRRLGPGGAYAPNPAADWHLLVGDDAALPAIGAALERLPAGATALAVLQVDGPADHQDWHTAADVRATWLHRADLRATGDVGEAAATQLLDAVAALEFPVGDVHAFVHGEAAAVRGLRRHLLGDRGVPRDALSVSGYWRRGRDEDGFRADKAAERAAEQTGDGAAAAAVRGGAEGR
ncbi:FAD-binding 9 siderophore-interacting domain protein [Pseudonocardia dioxanivorans CB1190]|uniref:FAD-binding 9 siderophore-interacting domain protein n=1 Tax=Pseudonocardia dioxanivorans (strain ATCC 55486 / DSM 44775 / JCM 13855 / CB1190) TaxID=675635 RepID=F4CLT4_PSEUX|nr:siderophore-interacting protein [Pseudonocardia dioxanivorans]AEA28216.1 FAD-binding 9 siderophore-interacting domain protein [Pseudonocardia dioxanivorans CB1190]